MTTTRCANVANVLLLVVLCLAAPRASYGQGLDDEDSKANTNVGLTLSAPLNPMAKNTNFGWGIVLGGGYNMSRHHAIVAEFMWNRLQAAPEALAPFRLALHSADINGHGNLFALTANYRYELMGHSHGLYFIGGGGFYYRNARLSKPVIAGESKSCTPAWLWWGFVCSSGTVTNDQTLASSGSGAFGVNGGVGFTVKVGEPRYRFYVEARYHYAPTSRINTQIIPVTVGIRF